MVYPLRLTGLGFLHALPHEECHHLFDPARAAWLFWPSAKQGERIIMIARRPLEVIELRELVRSR
jgi:hypothetical protein